LPGAQQCYGIVTTLINLQGNPMRTPIRKLGNSQGILIPKPILAQAGLEDEAEMVVENGAIVIRKPRAEPRAGWNEAARAIADSGDDALIWPAFANADDLANEW
jgi:antitoxin MazE